MGRLSDRVPGQAHRGGARGGGEQGDLGGGVEAESEEHADRVHLPGAVDGLHQAAEEAEHQPPLVELLLQLVVAVAAAAHLQEHLDDADQDDQVEDGDHVEEEAGDQGAEEAAEALQHRAGVADLTDDRLGSDA